jgi:hypothetical protein
MASETQTQDPERPRGTFKKSTFTALHLQYLTNGFHVNINKIDCQKFTVDYVIKTFRVQEVKVTLVMLGLQK